jgi:hypothetical protein
MKTITKIIKRTTLVFILLLSLNSYAQNQDIYSSEFVRVYNLQGKKINKGNVISYNDSLLVIKCNKKLSKIDIANIGFIKTKHSPAQNVAIGAVVGGGTLGVLGAASADPDAWIFGYTAAEGFAGGLILGGAAGAAVGGITALFKNSNTYLINGDLEKLKLCVKMISK